MEFLSQLFLPIWTEQSSSLAVHLSAPFYSTEIKSPVNLMPALIQKRDLPTKICFSHFTKFTKVKKKIVIDLLYVRIWKSGQTRFIFYASIREPFKYYNTTLQVVCAKKLALLLYFQSCLVQKHQSHGGPYVPPNSGIFFKNKFRAGKTSQIKVILSLFKS